MKYSRRLILLVVGFLGFTAVLWSLLDLHYTGGLAIMIITVVAAAAITGPADLAPASNATNGTAVASLLLALLLGLPDLWISTAFSALSAGMLAGLRYRRGLYRSCTGWLSLPTGQEAPVMFARARYVRRSAKTGWWPVYLMYARGEPIAVTEGYEMNFKSTGLPRRAQVAPVLLFDDDGRVVVPTRPTFPQTYRAPDGRAFRFVP